MEVAALAMLLGGWQVAVHPALHAFYIFLKCVRSEASTSFYAFLQRWTLSISVSNLKWLFADCEWEPESLPWCDNLFFTLLRKTKWPRVTTCNRTMSLIVLLIACAYFPARFSLWYIASSEEIFLFSFLGGIFACGGGEGWDVFRQGAEHKMSVETYLEILRGSLCCNHNKCPVLRLLYVFGSLPNGVIDFQRCDTWQPVQSRSGCLELCKLDKPLCCTGQVGLLQDSNNTYFFLPCVCLLARKKPPAKTKNPSCSTRKCQRSLSIFRAAFVEFC